MNNILTEIFLKEVHIWGEKDKMEILIILKKPLLLKLQYKGGIARYALHERLG